MLWHRAAAAAVAAVASTATTATKHVAASCIRAACRPAHNRVATTSITSRRNLSTSTDAQTLSSTHDPRLRQVVGATLLTADPSAAVDVYTKLMPEWEVGDNWFSNNASRNYKVCADYHSLRAVLRAQVSSTSAGSASYDIHLGDGTWVANIGSTSADRDLE